tara:strand:- start:4963 stop:6507 length:1545 start_codon:yes stop_codon:yes gene_type:complete
MLTRAIAGCVVTGLCLVAASQLDGVKNPGLKQIGLDAGHEAEIKPLGTPTRALGIQTERIVSGLSRPVYAGHAPGDESRLFIIEARSGSTGRIRIYDLNTETLLSTPYLSVSPVSTSSEQGLLGMAFHPDFYNGKPYIYVNYTASNGDTIIRRYSASGNNPNSNTASSSSGTTIMSIDQTYSNHNGGWLDFGTDGYLYIGMGDGGGAGDTFNDAQDINSLLGKMLRINVDGGFPYTVPADNPYVGTNGADEIWSIGLRNPWGCSFDRETGDLWMGDVGQYQWEEISFEPVDAEPGRNYGWRCYEGDNTFNTSGCPPSSNLTFPVFEYSHSGGRCSITGGFVYRGQDIPWMRGYYIYGDYCSSNQYVFSYDPSSDTVSGFQDVTNELRSSSNGGTVSSISRYGEDARGELYVCDLGGEVFRIIPGTPPAPTGVCCWNENCYLVTESSCSNVGGEYKGDYTACSSFDCTAQPCPGDVDEDGFVNVSDLLGVIASWNDPYTVDDLLTVIANWNSTCP